MLDSFLLNPGGIIFLSFLIPLIMLYLIRPKPRRKTIPSLMFLLKDTGRNPINKLFRSFMSDLLIIFHILIVLFLAGSLARPYIMVSQESLVEDSVFVIDVSASMSIGDRWDEALDAVMGDLASTNTLILAQRVPEVFAEKAPLSSTKKLIRGLRPKDTTTNLADAIKLAGDYAGSGSRVVVVSDFLPSEGGADIGSQIDALRSKGAIVKTVVIGKPVKNVGIIDLAVRDDESRVWIKNYADSPSEVNFKIGSDSQKLLLGRFETKELSFKTPEGVTELSISDKDPFMVDNKAWISTPTRNKIRVLVFTNDKSGFEKSRLKLSWDLIAKNFPIDFEYDYMVPPKVVNLDHDIYLFHKVNHNFLLPGVVKKLRERVSDGAALIITAYDGLFATDFQGLMPVDYVDSGGLGDVSASSQNLLTKDVDFGQVQSYYRVKPKEGAAVVAGVGDDPIITLSKFGNGMVVYYGYVEGKESFSADNSYPVFWRRMIDLITNRPSLRTLNIRTGSILSFPEEKKVVTPVGKTKTRLLRADYAGLYVFDDRTVAANLLSDLESNTNRAPVLDQQSSGEGDKREEKVPFDLSSVVMILGLLLLVAEVIYVKLRGDL